MAAIAPRGRLPLLDGTLKNLFYPPEEREYTYFARAAALPFAGGSALVKAAWAADASMLAYARYGSARMPDADFHEYLSYVELTNIQKIGDWNNFGTQAFFAYNDEFALLAFRGTEADDPSDSLADADIVPVLEPDYRPAPADPKPALRHLALVEHLFRKPCLVHRGFQRALNSVWEEVHDCITRYRARHPRTEICLTGHSLGGALATLAFSRFSDRDLSLITFGCPRVGNQTLRDRATGNGPRFMFRCVNFNDAVTHVPLENALYCHAPDRYHRFDQDGNLEEGTDNTFRGDVTALESAFSALPHDLRAGLDQIPAPPSIVDHSPARYCIRLWNCI